MSDMAEITPFELLSIMPTYTLNWVEIDHQFTTLQQTIHPDRYPSGSQERDIAESLSRQINNAYTILKNPLQRAKALFDVKRIMIPGVNGQTIDDPTIMEEALVLKESLEVAVSTQDFKGLIETLKQQQQALENTFSNAFEASDETEMKKTYIRLSFCIKTLNDAKEKSFESMDV
jgi:molecular chaperone HscB